MPTAFISTTTAGGQGGPVLADTQGPSVAFLKKDQSGAFEQPTLQRRYEQRQAAVQEVERQAAAARDFVVSHSLLRAEGLVAGPDVERRRKTIAAALQQAGPEQIDGGLSPADLDSLLVMTSLGSSALGSRFEGWSSFKAAGWWSRVIHQINAGNRLFSSAEVGPKATAALATMLQRAEAQQDPARLASPDYVKLQADIVMRDILSLAQGRSYCLVGGWSGRHFGHAMIYRFERNDAGSFNVYLYNAQEGSWDTEGGRRSGGKWQSRPCYVFENVTSEELFFTREVIGQPNSVMIRRLLELRGELPPGEKRGLQDVLNCFCRLQSKLVPGNKMRNLYLRTQRSGNCAVKSINCLLLDLLNDPKAYKQLVLDERLLGLLVYRQALYQSLGRLPPAQRTEARGYLRKIAILRRSARNFLTILEKNYRSGLIDLDAYKQGFATVKDLLDELKVKEGEIRTVRLREEQVVEEAPPAKRIATVLSEEQILRGHGVAALGNIPPAAVPPAKQVVMNPLLGERDTWNVAVGKLRGIMTAALDAKLPRVAISQFELTIGHLFNRMFKAGLGPDGNPNFGDLARGLAPAIQADLTECLRIYSESVYSQEGTPSMRVQNSGMAAMALSYALGCWYEAGSSSDNLSRFGIHIAHFERLTGRHDMVCAPLDGAAVEQRNALLTFWRRINSRGQQGNELFNFESQKVNFETVTGDRVPELQLYHGYRPLIEAAQVAPDDTEWVRQRCDPVAQQEITLFRTLKKEGFPPALAHIGALKQTALLAFGLFLPGGESTLYQNKGDVTWDTKYGVSGRHWSASDKDIIKYARIEEPDYPRTIQRPGAAPESGRFIHYTTNTQHWHIRGSGGIQSENDLLAMARDVVDERDLALSEPGMQSFLLLGALEHNLADLSNPERRAFIEAELFKTVEVQKRNALTGAVETLTSSPLCDQLRGDFAFIEHLDRLTDICLKQLVEATPRDPKWQEVLFIVRLRASVFANKLDQDPIFRLSPASRDINARIFNWLRSYDLSLGRDLATPDLIDEKRTELFQKRRELALAHAGLLLSLPTADIDFDPNSGLTVAGLPQRAELLGLMLKINQEFQSFSKVESRPFLRECQHRFASRLHILADLPPGQLDQLANGIVEKLDSAFTGRPGWRFVDGQLKLDAVAATPDKPALPAYVIDLARPMVFRDGKELSRGTFMVTEDFQRLFKDRQYEVSQAGPNSESIFFRDERWGEIRIDGRGPDAKIWRFYPEGPAGKWLLYCQGSADDLQINDALSYDHAHWLDVDTKEVLIFDLQDGNAPLYRIKKPTAPGGPSSLVNCRGGREFCRLSKDFNAAIERFEDIGQVNAWSQGEVAGQTMISRLEFPRFRMQDSCLHFDWDERSTSWLYGADRRFKISTRPSLPLLDGLSRYLHLEQEEPDKADPRQMKVVKRKVLIPAGKVTSRGFEEYVAIGLKSGASDHNKLSLKYFEYEYDEEKNELVPVPDVLEARIYLAHLYLGQKRYQEARAILKKISISANPSPEAVALLQDMLRNSEGLHDLSPNACAVRLYAYLIFKKIKPRDAEGVAIDYEKVGDKNSEFQVMADIYKTYLFAQRAVEAPLVFDPETELEIFEFLRVGDELAWRRNDLLMEIDQILQSRGVPLAVRSPSSTEAWELPTEVHPSIWTDLSHFVPDWPALDRLENVRPGSRLSYEGNYAKFAATYARIRGLPPLEQEAFAFELISAKDRLGFTQEQRDLLLFAVGHPEFNLPLPEGGDAQGRWQFCNQLRMTYPGSRGEGLGLKAAVPSAVVVPATTVAPADLAVPSASTAALLAGPVAVPPPLPIVTAIGLDAQLKAWQGLLLEIPPAPTEPPQRRAIGTKGELDRYAIDRDIARESEALRPRLNRKTSPLAVMPEMETARDAAIANENTLRSSLLALANRPPPDLPSAIAAQITKDGRARPDLDINTILRAAATSSEALQKLNPFLAPPEVEILRSLCLDYMVVTTHREHIERILKPLTLIRDELATAQTKGRPLQIDPQWEQDFVDALAQPRTYNPYDTAREDYFPLLFEYMSGMRVWGNQASIIRSVLNAIVDEHDPYRQSKIFQRIMAGGKTSVIVSILLETISQSGQLPVVLCHHSQYASVSGNLHNFQESRYDKDVYAIDYDLRQLGNPEIVQEMIAKIQEADQKGCSLLMKSSMPQVIELKFITDAISLAGIRPQKQEYNRRIDALERALRSAAPQARAALIAKKQKMETDLAELTRREQAVMQNVGLLGQVIKIFKTKGVGVLDECDIILSMLMDVNVPRGAAEMLTPERAELVREIYGCLISDEKLPPDPRLPPGQPQPEISIRNFVDLEHNNQAKLSKADFNARVAPFVAGKLLDNYYNNFRLKGMWGDDRPGPDPELRAAFSRYINNEISEADQLAADQWVRAQMRTLREGEDLELRVKDLPRATAQEGNFKFLCSLAALKRSDNKYKQAAADKIALSGRIVRDVLQLALAHSCDRAYGRDPANETGKVIPFLGMNEPATTHFGYVYLALCYQFQAALNKPISLTEVRFLAEKMGEAAQSYAQTARNPAEAGFEDQPEAKWFFEKTGVLLSEALKDPKAMARACDHINSDLNLRLAFEAEVAPFHVRYHREQVSSNPINLAEQLRKMFGCSGTPWNWHSYHRKAGDLEADRGVEGKILNAMFEREMRSGHSYSAPSPYLPVDPRKPHNIYESIATLQDDGLQPILNHLKQHPQRHRVRALIDGGGFLKGTNNAAAAEAILKLHHDPSFCAGQPPAIDAVIYLHQEVVAGKLQEKFVILKRLEDGSVRREELPDTTAPTLANCGVPKERIFVLFDELRATGSDIPMADDTICLQTIDPRTPVRTLLQAALRARGYFKGQDCEFLVTQKGRADMRNGGKKLQDIVDTLIENQAEAVGEQTFRSYLAQMTNAVRVAVLQEMLSATEPDAVAETAEKYRSFLVSSFEDDPYQQFARVEGPKSTGAVLLNHARNTLFSYYWKRLDLEASVPAEPESQRRPVLDSLAQALREYVDAVLACGKPLDRETTLLPGAQAGLGGDLSPLQRAKITLYQKLCEVGRGQDVAIEASILRLQVNAQKDIEDHVLPEQLRYQQGLGIDSQVEIEREREVNVAVAQEQEQELAQALQTTLAEMDLKTDGLPGYVEKMWMVPEVRPGRRLELSSLQLLSGSGGVGPGVQSVQDVCKLPYPPPVGNKLAQCSLCFPQHLYMTDNLRKTFEGFELPLLHRKMKFANFMLVIDSQPPGEPQFVLLSDRDAADFFGDWIRKCQPSNAWLVDMNGLEVVTNNGHPLPTGTTDWEDGLWAANLFNGNGQYFDSHEEQTQRVFELVSPARRQIMCDFAALRSYHVPAKRKAVARSRLIVPSREVIQKGQELVFSARRIKEQKVYEDVRSWGAAAAWDWLDPQSVHDLQKMQLQYLVTRDQVAQVAPDRLKFLVPAQANLLQPSQVAALKVTDPDELKLLQGITAPILFAQIKDPAFVPLATDKQIHLLAPEQLPWLSDEQIKGLTPEEVARWPRTDPNIWRLAMVRNELAVPADIRERLLGQVNTLEQLSMADVAGWLVPRLDQAHVLALPTERLNEISPAQAKNLPANLVQHLQRAELVQALEDPVQIRNLNADAARHLTPRQKGVLGDYISRLEAPLLKELPDWCSADDFAWSRFRRLDRETFTSLRIEQQRWVSGRVAGLTPDELAQVAAADMNATAPNYLSDHYLESLSRDQLNAFDDRHRILIPRLNRYRLQLLQGARVDLVPVGRLSELLPEQYLQITDDGLINAAVLQRLVRRDLRQEQLQKLRTVEALLQLDNVDAGLSDAQTNMLAEHFDVMPWPELQITLREKPWTVNYAFRRLLKLSSEDLATLEPAAKEAIRQYIQEQPVADIACWLASGDLAEHYLTYLSELQVNTINPSERYPTAMPGRTDIIIPPRDTAAQLALLNALPETQMRMLNVAGLVSYITSDKVRCLIPELRDRIDTQSLLHLRDLEGITPDQLMDLGFFLLNHKNDLALLARVPECFWPQAVMACLALSEQQFRQLGQLNPALCAWVIERVQRLSSDDVSGYLYGEVDARWFGSFSDEQLTRVVPLSDNDLQRLEIKKIAQLFYRGKVDPEQLGNVRFQQDHAVPECNDLDVTNPAELALLKIFPARLIQQIDLPKLQAITDESILRVIDKRRQANDFTPAQIKMLYPRNLGMRVLAFGGLLLSAIFFLPLLFLFSATYRDWWQLAWGGIRSEDSYIAARRSSLRHLARLAPTTTN